MKDLDNEKLPQEVRWEIAKLLREERLDTANSVLEKVSFKDTFYSKYGKRFLDIIFSFTVLVITFPINLVMGIVSFFDVGSPLFFSQERTGKNGKIFKVTKFRSMTNDTDEYGRLLPPDQRVTKWGKFIRRTSLDELLNFWSIFKGDMSVIGPRPLPPQYYERYADRHLARHYVRPGLECPPRNIETDRRDWNDQFENDIWYVQNVSLKTDIKLIFSLVSMVFNRKSTARRATGLLGDFIGYSADGRRVISVYDVEDRYIEQALKNCNITLEEAKAYDK